MCIRDREKNCYFLNLWEVLADENGDLIESYAQPDGYHIKPEGYACLLYTSRCV